MRGTPRTRAHVAAAATPLIEAVERACTGNHRTRPNGFHTTAVPGLTFFRSTAPVDPLDVIGEPPTDEPAICVVLQGRKDATIGMRRVRYAPQTYTLSSFELPVTDMVVDGTAERPFLGVRLALDVDVLAELLLELPAGAADAGLAPSITVGTLSDVLLDSLARLVDVLADPHDAAVLAPTLRHEISYRLLRGPDQRMLRQIVTVDSHHAHIRRAVDWIREHYATSFRVDTVAALAHMSPSSFHQHFKDVTSLSPLQYQKQLRLHEARRLMIGQHVDATTAAYRVGYSSRSQFNREYKRLFGAPPAQDMLRLREAS